MPKSSLSYLYEMKIFETINLLASKLIDDYDLGKMLTFVLIYKSEQDSFEVTLLNDNDKYFEFVDKLEKEGVSFFFLDNFEPRFYTYISWNKINLQKMEGLRGEAFEDEDFIHMRSKKIGQYRECGSVMLG